MMNGRTIKREDAASIFYNDSKMRKFYRNNVPNCVTLKEVHNRLELVTKSGKRRNIQGKSIF